MRNSNTRNNDTHSDHSENSQFHSDKLLGIVPNAILFNRNTTSRKYSKSPVSAKEEVLIDYKNIGLISKFTSKKGRILPSRITMMTRKHQRKLKKAIKVARELALMPFVADL